MSRFRIAISPQLVFNGARGRCSSKVARLCGKLDISRPRINELQIHDRNGLFGDFDDRRGREERIGSLGSMVGRHPGRRRNTLAQAHFVHPAIERAITLSGAAAEGEVALLFRCRVVQGVALAR